MADSRAWFRVKPSYRKAVQALCAAATRAVVLRRLEEQRLALGAIRPRPRITLCLAAGRIVSSADRLALHSRFRAEGWLLWDEEWIGQQLAALAEGGYENDVAAVVAKLLLRGTKRKGLLAETYFRQDRGARAAPRLSR